MWEKDNSAEQELPGIQFTTKQLFWIAAAQVIFLMIFFKELSILDIIGFVSSKEIKGTFLSTIQI